MSANKSLMQRGGIWHLRRRVPERFKKLEPRKTICLTLRTDDREVAAQRAVQFWDEQLAEWEVGVAVGKRDSTDQVPKARALAERRGYRFLEPYKIARLTIPEIVERVEEAHDKLGRPIPALVAALLGSAQPPPLTVSRALELFWGLTTDRTYRKTPSQLIKWQNSRKKAVNFFIKTVGDFKLEELTADDFLEYRDAQWLRVKHEGIKSSTVNKEIGQFLNILWTIRDRFQLDLVLPGKHFKLAELDRHTTRPPFSTSWIQSKIMAPEALSKLNTQARCLLLGMINTGYRPSEGAWLLADDIVLDAQIPHIKIHDEHRVLKTHYSNRIIPLSGISLEAFRQCPNGFQRYRDSSTVTNTVNKFLRTNDLRETPRHTMYSLRHSFEDRLLNLDLDERVRRDLMGHKLDRSRYGRGANLEKLSSAINLIAL